MLKPRDLFEIQTACKKMTITFSVILNVSALNVRIMVRLIFFPSVLTEGKNGRMAIYRLRGFLGVVWNGGTSVRFGIVFF